MSHVDRKSKYTKLTKLPDKSADSSRACGRILLPLANPHRTITYDNGKEFASHAEIVAALGAKSYFAKPYPRGKRGLNEHTNGLVRQYFPKGTTSLRVERRRPKGRGQTQLPPPQDTRLPNPKRGFPDGRLTRLLHFTVEWATLYLWMQNKRRGKKFPLSLPRKRHIICDRHHSTTASADAAAQLSECRSADSGHSANETNPDCYQRTTGSTTLRCFVFLHR